MTLSLYEIEVTGKRAARGCGLSWGIAEEAGKAVRWLSEHGLPGAEELAETLNHVDGKTYEDLAPTAADGVWHARSGRLCPLICGPAICDRAVEIAAGREIEFGPMSQPLLLASYAAAAAKLIDGAVELAWPGIVLVATSDGIKIDGERKALTVPSVEHVRCRRADRTDVPSSGSVVGCAVDAEAWRRLSALAHRTLAPATDESRLAGAGAGLIDTD